MMQCQFISFTLASMSLMNKVKWLWVQGKEPDTVLKESAVTCLAKDIKVKTDE